MATLLYRLGRFSFRRRSLVALLWVVVLALFGVGAATLSGPTSDAFSIPGTESSRALDVLEEKFGSGSDGTTSKVVFTVDGDAKLTGTAQKAAIEKAVAELAKAPQVVSVADPFTAKTISEDAQTAYATVSYAVGATEVTDAARDGLFAAGRSAESAGIEVEFSGESTVVAESSQSTEGIGIIIAAIVLVITFGALIAAGLPLLTAAIGVGLGMCGIQIATGFFDLSSSTSALATMLGLAVGIDYALFIVSRFRHELAQGRDGEEAAGRATGTAGSAVVFAGLTVIIALAALSVTGIPFLTAMGLAAAGTVLMAVIITLTLTPALLGFAGRKVLPKKDRTTMRPPTGKMPFGERWARLILKNRILALVLTLGAITVVALPALNLQLALPDDSTAAPDSTQRKAYDQLAEGFGAGFNGPLIVVVENTTKAAAADAQAIIGKLDDVVLVTSPTMNQAGDTAMLTVIPGSGGTDEATKNLVTAIRDLNIDGADLAVTGTTAINIDVTDKITKALVPYLAIVVGLALILLMLVFRSILVPLKATLGFLLSVAATFGAVVFVFQEGHLAGLLGVTSTGPIISLMPIFLIGILFGLAMDYEVFLVTRTREEFVHGAAPNAAVISGMRHGARVVTAAALIMMSVFAGFILADDTIIKTLGFALAFGVAVDAFLVRMTIVPAVLSLFGKAAWWLPTWLDKILPNVDVEGEGLTKQLAAAEAGQDPNEKDLVNA
ncbi:RND superfamily putative drug exporter [Actinoplanes tereljensis]|uniref:Membrane protein n=1 Tax=Paractinoplanes tereljensis TaxID=571912 RepID=A0A919TSR1_9ACTN|nr:MMPL family transporter [Actinoplanes tereljensis]GIF20826.1 membrane protein [Actinoplanes tereljensis]